MNYSIKLHNSVAKFLKKCNNKFFRRISDDFDKLIENPYNHKELDITKLKGSDDDYRLRIGKYRFIYTVIQTKLLIYIYKAGSRGDVYKK